MLTVALVITGWAVVYISSQCTLKRMRAELSREFQERVDSLSAAVTALERTEIAAPETAAAAPVMPKSPAIHTEPANAVEAAADSTPSREEIMPDTLALIAASVTAFLGKKVRIRSARTLQTPHDVNPWARQGRAMVQTSHNIAGRGR